MSDNGKQGAAHYDNAPAHRKGHCRRFWWVYLLVLLVIVVIVVPVVLLVAVPKMAQQKLDEAVLSLQGISATDTKTLSLTMGINSTITTDGKVHATVHAFDGVMYLEDLEPHTPFLKLRFPETESSAFQMVNLSQATPIDDLGAFTTFNKWLLHNETLRVTLKGDTTVRVQGIARDYPVTFQKTIDMPGLNGFKGTTVANVSISIGGFSDGTNMRGTTTIPNRSLVTFEIGNASFTNYLLGEEIGTAFIDNMVLRPGLNDFAMRAKLDQMPVAAAVSEKPYCENGILPFILQGKTVVNHGEPLAYYADALASSNQTVDIDVTGPFKDLGLEIKCSAD